MAISTSNITSILPINIGEYVKLSEAGIKKFPVINSNIRGVVKEVRDIMPGVDYQKVKGAVVSFDSADYRRYGYFVEWNNGMLSFFTEEYLEKQEIFNPPFPILTWETPLGSALSLNSDPSNQTYSDSGTDDQSTAAKIVKKPKEKKLSLSGVVLDDDKRREIMAAISQVDNKDKIFEEWGFKDVFEKGTAVTLLFYGVPGTGKTLTAQVIAEELKMNLKIYGTAEIQSSEPGGAERAIKRIFQEATELITGKLKQQVILFDECDSLLYSREKVGAIMAAQINTLLSEIERYAGVVIFTTNRLGKLDSALERRLSAKIEFPFPDAKAREQIWKRMIPKKAPIDKKVKFSNLAKLPLAGGNIKNVVLNAARYAAFDKADTIQLKHFSQALEKEMKGMAAFKGNDEWTDQGGEIESEMVAGGIQQKIVTKKRQRFSTKLIEKEDV